MSRSCWRRVLSLPPTLVLVAVSNLFQIGNPREPTCVTFVHNGGKHVVWKRRSTLAARHSAADHIASRFIHASLNVRQEVAPAGGPRICLEAEAIAEDGALGARLCPRQHGPVLSMA